TPAACLGGMSRVNRNYRTAPFLGFVPDIALQLGERPGVDAAFGCRLPLRLDALSDLGQVFQHNRRTRLDRLDDLLTQHMVTVAAKALLFPAHLAQMPFGRLRTLLLQGALELEQASFDCLPRALAQETVVRCDGGTRQTQINPNYLIGG